MLKSSHLPQASSVYSILVELKKSCAQEAASLSRMLLEECKMMQFSLEKHQTIDIEMCCTVIKEAGGSLDVPEFVSKRMPDQLQAESADRIHFLVLQHSNIGPLPVTAYDDELYYLVSA
ncbi:hypothetical protein V6N11_012403 [Hibiscus sabdariffa]|uniref:Uncharacterized protein n=1 Tax=Hibiscus sabdariffa TaxID=183260 RepID=A0ABR2QB09_9ROSI